jgi:hypothetical protein
MPLRMILLAIVNKLMINLCSVNIYKKEERGGYNHEKELVIHLAARHSTLFYTPFQTEIFSI